MENVGKKESWHIDHSLNVGIILIFLIQITSFIWFFAKMDSRLTFVEKTQEETSVDGQRLSVLEAKIEGIHETILEIKNILKENYAKPRSQ